jgi:hypothetical protein
MDNRNLFGEELHPLGIKVYHDESGTFGSSRWCCIGLLWSIEHNENEMLHRLLKARIGEDYWGKIHYSDLPSKFEGEYGKDARVARDWLNIYINNLSQILWFNALAIDTHCKAYDGRRFKQDFHAYNRFTAMSLYGAIKWNFPENKHIKLTMYSDDKNRGIVGDGVTRDNFEVYIGKRLDADLFGDRSMITVDFDFPIRMVNIPKCRDEQDMCVEDELLQLCDLLLGSTQCAITGASQVETKSRLAKRLSPLITDTRKKPWEQQFNLHRRFSVRYFPNAYGQIYADGQLAIEEDRRQLRLFEDM